MKQIIIFFTLKMKSKILFITLIFVAYSCSQQGDKSILLVDVNGSKMAVFSLNDLKSDITTVPLSHLVENCILVQLETKDEAFFKPWFTTITEKYIGIRDYQTEPYKLFDLSGKFLCNVGAVGQGPGEYSIAVYDDIIDDKNELIYLAAFMGDKILVYKTSEEYFSNIRLRSYKQRYIVSF